MKRNIYKTIIITLIIVITSAISINGCLVSRNQHKNQAHIKEAVVIPTDITEIDYPSFYNNPVCKNITVENAYCAIDKDHVAYPVEYLGKYQFPKIEGAPLSPSIERIIGIKDVWMPEPNMNRYCTSKGYNAMREAFEKTLTRIKTLGADGISFTNYVHFVDFENANIENLKDAAVPEDDLRFAANKAQNQGLDVILYLNLAPGNEEVTLDIHGKEWLIKLINNWSVFLTSQATLAEETNIDAIMLNHFDYEPDIKGYEEVYQKEMLLLLQNVRNIYSGKILLMINQLWTDDMDKFNELFRQVDGFIYTPVTDILRDKDDKTVIVDNLKPMYLDNLLNLGSDFKKYNKPIYLRILIQSSEVFLSEGWHEEMFCIQQFDDPCYQKNLKVDFSSQAIAYEAMMEAIERASNDHLYIGAVDAYGYWYTDVILPDVSHPQIGQSIRNKPAESIVMQWYKR